MTSGDTFLAAAMDAGSDFAISSSAFAMIASACSREQAPKYVGVGCLLSKSERYQ
jgi:hypothetical protein